MTTEPAASIVVRPVNRAATVSAVSTARISPPSMATDPRGIIRRLPSTVIDSVGDDEQHRAGL
jgi:hypothetical protein